MAIIGFDNKIQWGSVNRTRPVFEWSKCVRLWNGPDHLKSGHYSLDLIYVILTYSLILQGFEYLLRQKRSEEVIQ